MSFFDARPPGTADHGRLRNLDENHHPQYALSDHAHAASAATPYVFSKNIAFTVASAVITEVPFAPDGYPVYVVDDVLGMAGDTRITFPEAGLYAITASLFAPAKAADYTMEGYLQGHGQPWAFYAAALVDKDTPNGETLHWSVIARYNAGDSVSLDMFHDFASDVTDCSSYITCVRVAP